MFVDKEEIENIANHNSCIMRTIETEYGIGVACEINDIIEEDGTIGKMEFVDEFSGADESDSYDLEYIKSYHVDQYQQFEDVYSGYMFFQLPDDRYLKVPYEC